ncbi:MAG: GH32 C-terminal domain-containing protein [Segetibacter sp.]
MSNWQYANVVPTVRWRSAMTVPRELKLIKADNNYLLKSMPVKELDGLKKNTISLKNIQLQKQLDLSQWVKELPGQYQIKLTANEAKDFSITLSNGLAEEVVVGYNKEENEYYIDRTKSGKADFEKGFAKRMTGPRLAKSKNLNLTLIVDAASAELFADDGLTVMTGIFFPNEPFNNFKIKSPGYFVINELQYAEMKSIWQGQSNFSTQKQSTALFGQRDERTGVKAGSVNGRQP